MLLIFVPLIYYVYKYLKLQVLLLNSVQLQNKPIYLSKQKYLISRNKINEIYDDKLLYKHKSLGQTIYNNLYDDKETFVSPNKPVLDEKINNIIKNNDLDENAIKTKLEEKPELIDNLELLKIMKTFY